MALAEQFALLQPLLAPNFRCFVAALLVGCPRLDRWYWQWLAVLVNGNERQIRRCNMG
jgi:hypothetical protein